MRKIKLQVEVTVPDNATDQDVVAELLSLIEVGTSGDDHNEEIVWGSVQINP
jgi:hypothetical protein